MIQTIRLQDIYGPDLFSRAKATQLVNYMDVDAESFVLDFKTEVALLCFSHILL